jgi:phosphoglycolate phosphatase
LLDGSTDTSVALDSDLDQTGDALHRRPPLSPSQLKRFDGAVIAFDLDGTLVDTAPDLMNTLNTVLGEQGLPPLPFEMAPLLVGRGAKVMLERGFAADGKPLEDPEASRLFERYIEVYLAHICDHSRPYPGVLEALDRFEAEGAILAVCTNKRTDLSLAVLDALDLTKQFKVIVGADMAPRPKPDASHLLHTIELAGGDPNRALMVGDSINDVLAAKNAQVPVVVVSYGYTDVPAKDLGGDVLIDGFDELYAVAEGLLPPLSR